MMVPLVPIQMTDEQLEELNDASAARAAMMCSGEMFNSHLSACELNSLVCEIQAWRSMYPTQVFVSGSNVLVEKINR